MSEDVLKKGRSLVLAAFDEARASGRASWHQMTTAVLKNRLLNSTNREFHEKDFGVSSMVEFARLFPNDLDVDARRFPPLIILKRPDVLPGQVFDSDDAPVRQRIRPDLWRAMVDYRSGATYVWDDTGYARVANPNDSNPVLPTITEADVATWRAEFAGSMKGGLSSASQDRLDEWLRNQYGAGFLPAGVRGQWIGLFRRKVLARLENFFHVQEIAVPADLATDVEGAPDWPRIRGGVDPRVADLRALVQRCVAVMSEEELADLRIAPAVFLRATRGRSS